MTTAPSRSGTHLLATPSLALAYERIAELRAAAEHERLVRAADADHRPARARRPWPAGLVTALRDSLATWVPAGAARRGRPCPTC